MGLPSASSAIRYAIETVYRKMIRDEARAEAQEAQDLYYKSLGLD